MRTIHYISIGNKSNIELNKSIQSLINSNTRQSSYLVNIITSEIDNNLSSILYRNNYLVKIHIDNSITSNLETSRQYKTRLNNYQSKYNLYIDSDTIIRDNLSSIFDMLDNYDLVISVSTNQGDDIFWHIDHIEKEYTLEQLGFIPLQLQCGVFGWRESEQVDELFKQWNIEYQLYRDQDQAAFIRALYKVPVKIGLLGKAFNSSNGSVIQHNFGKIR